MKKLSEEMREWFRKFKHTAGHEHDCAVWVDKVALLEDVAEAAKEVLNGLDYTDSFWGVDCLIDALAKLQEVDDE